MKAFFTESGGKPDETISETQISELTRETRGAIPVIRGAKFDSAAVFDFEEMKRRNEVLRKHMRIKSDG